MDLIIIVYALYSVGFVKLIGFVMGLTPWQMWGLAGVCWACGGNMLLFHYIMTAPY